MRSFRVEGGRERRGGNIICRFSNVISDGVNFVLKAIRGRYDRTAVFDLNIRKT